MRKSKQPKQEKKPVFKDESKTLTVSATVPEQFRNPLTVSATFDSGRSMPIAVTCGGAK